MNAFHGAATLRLETDRLVLVALTAELVDALADREAAQVTLRSRDSRTAGPDTELAGLLRIYGPLVARSRNDSATARGPSWRVTEPRSSAAPASWGRCPRRATDRARLRRSSRAPQPRLRDRGFAGPGRMGALPTIGRARDREMRPRQCALGPGAREDRHDSLRRGGSDAGLGSER